MRAHTTGDKCDTANAENILYASPEQQQQQQQQQQAYARDLVWVSIWSKHDKAT